MDAEEKAQKRLKESEQMVKHLQEELTRIKAETEVISKTTIEDDNKQEKKEKVTQILSMNSDILQFRSRKFVRQQFSI